MAARFKIWVVGTAAWLVIAVLTAVASAQPAPDYGLTWQTIGAAGNRATIPSEVPLLPDRQVGAVAYEYRLTQTEITAGQWLEFAQAYVRWHPQASGNSELMGWYMNRDDANRIFILPAAANLPNTQSWRMAARFCNWLHNGKVDAAWAFEQGAYDASTFTDNPDGTRNDQITRSPGALFWIPSRDEWVKGAFYDPDRYGPGQGGYWLSPNRSNDILISGPPGAGQTSAGFGYPPDTAPPGVGSYPDVRSPWGLLDLSGGEREWTETMSFIGDLSRYRTILGSAYRTGPYTSIDRPDDVFSTGSFPSDIQGLRVASVVPAPYSALAVLGGVVGFFRRRSREVSCALASL